ncbi:hypothetical protein [Paenibacillus sp. PSB04]|uniref:hypothetical protein n=1 Tax=Paenibacillus sp. PSB04 TaxID=2866810 RepID=UPI0021F1F110|nr:hypothetical protein [Paenibacillus sp. PSB04]UYO06417.1 hypothetical protein K2F33_11320 [Paenibacillus sp. PSB04]
MKRIFYPLLVVALLFMALALTGKRIFEYAPTVGWIGAVVFISLSLIIAVKFRSK